MTRDELVGSMGCTPALADAWIDHLNATFDLYDINTKARLAAFIAQIGHESGGLTIGRENMNYSADRLLVIFPTHFSANQVDPGFVNYYAHQPEKIANRAYASRMGNGDENSGDGFKFRGGGLMQLTGRDDYRDFGNSISVDLIGQPDLIQTPRVSAMSAGWEWNRGHLNLLADASNFERMTRIINGGLNGYQDRLVRWVKAKGFLCA
jgi:putative chitinase